MDGLRGLNGVSAPSLVVKVSSKGAGSATIPLQINLVNSAKEMQRMSSRAIKSRALV